MPKRKIHKKKDEPPKKIQISEVECGAEYPTSISDTWQHVTCLKCLEKKENESS